jgi:hypothetical protein
LQVIRKVLKSSEEKKCAKTTNLSESFEKMKNIYGKNVKSLEKWRKKHRSVNKWKTDTRRT